MSALKYAFCKKCETQVVVQLKSYPTSRGRRLDILFCPLCDKVMNMDRWVRPLPLPEDGEVCDKSISIPQSLFRFAIRILPPQSSYHLNRLMNRLLGSYVVNLNGNVSPYDIPDFLDSVVNQLVILSGLQQNKGESEMEFLKRAVNRQKWYTKRSPN